MCCRLCCTPKPERHSGKSGSRRLALDIISSASSEFAIPFTATRVCRFEIPRKTKFLLLIPERKASGIVFAFQLDKSILGYLYRKV